MEVIGTKRSFDQATEGTLPASQSSQGPAPRANKRCDAQAASQRHIKTEQARRDKISAGFSALQELLPGREKVEKAMLLTQAVDYIQQLQGVLQTLMSTGLVSQLPDNLQWQIRTLLPRKDGRSMPAAPAPAPAPALPLAGQAGMGLQLPVPMGFGGLQMGAQPLTAQNPLAPTSGDKEGVKEGGESALLAQVQALLQQQQQQVAIQTWQQTLQALQLQQVLQQGQALPDLVNGLCAMGTGPTPFASLPLQMPQASGPLGGVVAPAPVSAGASTAKNPADCFVNELPRCGLQQLVDAAACQQQSEPPTRCAPSPHKARKNNVKVRRHTTAARIPKPADPNPPARASPGRPEPV